MARSGNRGGGCGRLRRVARARLRAPDVVVTATIAGAASCPPLDLGFEEVAESRGTGGCVYRVTLTRGDREVGEIAGHCPFELAARRDGPADVLATWRLGVGDVVTRYHFTRARYREVTDREVTDRQGSRISGQRLESRRPRTMMPRMMPSAACPVCSLEDVLSHPDRFECVTCGHEWPREQPVEVEPPEVARVVKDANGTPLADGDIVTLIKDLKLKGSSEVLKQGTRVKNIRLVDGDHEIDCKIDGTAMGLKACFVKKA